MKKTECKFRAWLALALFIPFGLSAQIMVTSGSATSLGGNTFQLTPTTNNHVGAVWGQSYLDLNHDFFISADINLGSKDNTGADGIAFVFQDRCTGAITLGGGMGYEGITPSLAIEFDTYSNVESYQNFHDPVNDHVGIQKNGNPDHGGSSNLAGPYSLSYNLEDGNYHPITIFWDASAQNITVQLDGATIVNQNVGNILTSIFSGNNDVIWGFTSATGGLNNDHRVRINQVLFTEIIPYTVTLPTCEETAGGAINMQLSGQYGPYTYSWSTGSTAQNISGLSVGVYTVTVTDANSCQSRFSIEVPAEFDMDADGYGDPNAECGSMDDCDDNDPMVFPGQTWYIDADGDGYAGSTATTCERPANGFFSYELSGNGVDDCNDSNPAIKPGTSEILGNGIDDNCDGLLDILLYCTPSISYPCQYMWITNVTIGSINNNSGCSGGYSDYSSQSTSVTAGNTYTISIKGSGYEQYSRVFVDWNNDGDFLDAGETAVNDLYTYTNQSNLASFAVPANATAGIHKMRVVSDYAGVFLPGSCNTTYGEVEDYTFVVASSCLEQTWYRDTDADGYAPTGAATLTQCLRPEGYKLASELSGTSGDCSDNDNTVYPGATDICDGKDNDCDGTTDEGGAGPAPGWLAGVIGAATNATSSFTCNSGNANGTVFNMTSQGFSGAANADMVNSNYQQRCGDASITARIASSPLPGWAGIYIRENLTPGSKMVALKTNLSSFLRREVRSTVNGNKTTAQNPLYASNTWVRIVRTGNTFAFYSSSNGTIWSLTGSTTVTMSSCVYIGLFAESINAATTISASFDNVAITGGAAPLAIAPGQGFEVQEEYTPLMNQILVYPNPSTGQVQIDLQDFSGKAVRIKVSNSFGSTVLNTKLEEALDTESLDLSEFAPGVYWLQVQAEGYAPQVQKIILHR